MSAPSVPPLTRGLLDAGIPVVICRPRSGWKAGSAVSDVIPPSGCNTITVEQARENIAYYQPGNDTLAMVAGHGIDVLDIDAKTGASLDDIPAGIRRYGLDKTPGGGWHAAVPSTGFGKGPLLIAGKHVGDYCGGTADGGGRLLVYLPGSSRPKYPGLDYVTIEEWDIDACLDSEPDDLLFDIVLASGGSRDGKPGRPAAGRGDVDMFLAEHSEVAGCTYGVRALRALLTQADQTVNGDARNGRHNWTVSTTARVIELMKADCLDSRALERIGEKLLEIKPEGGTNFDSITAWAIANTEPTTGCQMHSLLLRARRAS